MSELQTDYAPLNGLVDNRMAAAILGVEVNTFKVWATRAKHSSHGVPGMMPEPVGSMHGNVYLHEDILLLKSKLESRAAPDSGSAEKMTLVERRRLGSYFTPHNATELMIQWAIRSPDDVVLEPSLGDGSFLKAAATYAASRGWPQLSTLASELDEKTAVTAVQSGAIARENLHIGDFLKAKLPPVDVAIGNPPYVRIRALDGNQAISALHAARVTIGESMDNAGSVWMPFVSKSASHLKRGGRMAFVLPLDFTYVKYARPLWRYLASNFGSLSVLRFQQRVFPDILQNVLILLADEKGAATDHVKFLPLRTVEEFAEARWDDASLLLIDDICAGERVFQDALMSPETRGVYQALLGNAAPAKSRIKFNIGYVSGHKKFFHPSVEDVRHFGLPETSLRPTAVNTRQLRGGGLRTSSLPTDQFLWLPTDPLTTGEWDYVAQGEIMHVNAAYKCRIRDPWYVVPGVRTPDVLLTVFSDQPRLYLNDSAWSASNSVLCGYLRPGEIGEHFAASWYTPLTLLSSELEVHALGGGVMIAVPNEADAVRVLTDRVTAPLDESRLSARLAASEVHDAYSVGNSSLEALVGVEGTVRIWEGIETLSQWRKAKG